MTYKVAKKQPAGRDESLDWEEAGPGLYDDGEVLVQLGDIYAALTATPKWYTDNGGGVSFHGVARWCDKDGQTILSPNGEHAETAITMAFKVGDVDRYGLAALKKEMLLVLMGEDPELHRDIEGTDQRVPVVDLGDVVRKDASIRHAAAIIGAMNKVPAAADLLG